MNFDEHETEVEASRASRRFMIRTALSMCGFTYTSEDVQGIVEDLERLFGLGTEADREIVAHVSDDYFAQYFERKHDERNREAFKDELAARVWETVKGMTWYTDAQKVIPDDLASRVEQKRTEEAQELEELRYKLTGKRHK